MDGLPKFYDRVIYQFLQANLVPVNEYAGDV